MRNRTTILILGTAQFVMVLDSTVMNVSISQVVADLHTTVPDVQLAITAPSVPPRSTGWVSCSPRSGSA
jgi:predicted MFS family arabinose efflux permease